MRIRLVFCALFVGSLFGGSASGQESQPNVVLILMDNLGYGEIGAYGGGELRGAATPRIDSIADDGMRLTNFNVEAQCTPSRAALMTGRHPIRSGLHSVPGSLADYGLVNWEVTLAELASDAGYDTAIFGKWHLGQVNGRFPTDHGFDEWFGIANSTDEALWIDNQTYDENAHPMNAEPHTLQARRGAVPVEIRPYDIEERRQIDRRITEKAVEFIGQSSASGDAPFFLYLPMTQPHYPILPHPDFDGSTSSGYWGDILAQMDAYTGRIIDALEARGLTENTILIFTSDNGPDMQPEWAGSPGPWRGTYFTALEGSLRVPFLIRWPDGIEAGRVSNEIVHMVDLLPTFAELFGSEAPQDRIIDGISLVGFFRGDEKSGREGFPVYVGSRLQAIKWRDWKLHFFEQATGSSSPQPVGFPLLYNIKQDPRELRGTALVNSWTRYPMRQILEDHRNSLQEEEPIPMGADLDFVPERMQ